MGRAGAHISGRIEDSMDRASLTIAGVCDAVMEHVAGLHPHPSERSIAETMATAALAVWDVCLPEQSVDDLCAYIQERAAEVRQTPSPRGVH